MTTIDQIADLESISLDTNCLIDLISDRQKEYSSSQIKIFKSILKTEVKLYLAQTVIDEYVKNAPKELEKIKSKYAIDKKDTNDMIRLKNNKILNIEYKYGLVSSIIETAEIFQISTDTKLEISTRSVEKLAPFHNGRNNTADAHILFESYKVLRNQKFGFVSRNHKDFSAPGKQKELHPELAESLPGNWKYLVDLHTLVTCFEKIYRNDISINKLEKEKTELQRLKLDGEEASLYYRQIFERGLFPSRYILPLVYPFTLTGRWDSTIEGNCVQVEKSVFNKLQEILSINSIGKNLLSSLLNTLGIYCIYLKSESISDKNTYIKVPIRTGRLKSKYYYRLLIESDLKTLMLNIKTPDQNSIPKNLYLISLASHLGIYGAAKNMIKSVSKTEITYISFFYKNKIDDLIVRINRLDHRKEKIASTHQKVNHKIKKTLSDNINELLEALDSELSTHFSKGLSSIPVVRHSMNNTRKLREDYENQASNRTEATISKLIFNCQDYISYIIGNGFIWLPYLEHSEYLEDCLEGILKGYESLRKSDRFSRKISLYEIAFIVNFGNTESLRKILRNLGPKRIQVENEKSTIEYFSRILTKFTNRDDKIIEWFDESSGGFKSYSGYAIRTMSNLLYISSKLQISDKNLSIIDKKAADLLKTNELYLRRVSDSIEYYLSMRTTINFSIFNHFINLREFCDTNIYSRIISGLSKIDSIPRLTNKSANHLIKFTDNNTLSISDYSAIFTLFKPNDNTKNSSNDRLKLFLNQKYSSSPPPKSLLITAPLFNSMPINTKFLDSEINRYTKYDFKREYYGEDSKIPDHLKKSIELDRLINILLSKHGKIPSPYRSKIATISPYYEWYSDLENFDYKKFHWSWPNFYLTVFKRKYLSQSTKFKCEIRKKLNRDWSDKIAKLYATIFALDK